MPDALPPRSVRQSAGSTAVGESALAPTWLLSPGTIVLAAGLYLFSGGVAVLLGWAWDKPWLADWTRSGIAVQPNNALAIAAFGSALLLWMASGALRHPDRSPPSSLWRRAVRALAGLLAVVPMAIGAFTFFQHVSGFDLGIDRPLLFGRSWGAANVSSPGRMGPPASLCWTLLGTALAITALAPGRARWLGPAAALTALSITWIALLGLLYRINPLYTLPKFTAIAPLTTGFLLAAAIAALAAMPGREPARTILTDPGAAGRLARGAILPLLVIAPAIGLLRLRGEQEGWYDSAMGVVIMVVALSLAPTVVLWRAGRALSRHEAALQASEGLAKRIAGVAPVILYIYDLTAHRNVWGNKGMTDVLGYTRADLDAIGPGLVPRLIHPDDLGRYEVHAARLFALRDDETAELEYRMRHADGSWRWLHSRDTVFSRDARGNVTQILGAATDITRRRDAEAAHRESQANLAIATEAAALGIHEYEPLTGTLIWDARVRELWGVTPGEAVTYARFLEGLHPDDRAPTQAAVDAAFAPTGTGIYSAEYRVVVPGHPTRWIAATGRVMRDASGGVVRLVGTVQDVTARRVSEEQARESASRLRLALEAAGQGAWSQDGDTGLLHWDDRMKEIWGIPADASVSFENWLASVHLDDRGRVLAAIDVACGADGSGRYHEEYRIRRASDGVERWVEVVAQARPGRSDSEPVRWFGTAQDVTLRRLVQDELRSHRERLEMLVKQRTDELETSHQRLRLAERMAAIGTLSAGLGHDMGNILMPLRVRLETLEHLAPTDAARGEIEAIRALIAYLQRLAGGLRMLAIDPARLAPGIESTELSSWWPEAETVMRSALPRTMSFTARPLSAPVEVPISKAGLTQAVFNLVQNAGDAMRETEGGAVTVWFEVGDEHVLIGVSDTGPGMSEEVRRRCMEPFFTTKARGLSTGLGLALVYGLVREAGGSVDLQSEPGRGTTFTLRFPRAPRPGPDAASPRHALVRVSDARTRAFIAAELRHLGHIVHTASAPVGVAIDLAVVESGDAGPTSTAVLTVAPGTKLADIRTSLREAGAPRGVGVAG